MCAHKYGADYCKCVDVIDPPEKKVSRRRAIAKGGHNCADGCVWSKASEQCQRKSDTTTLAGCENKGDQYCDCVRDKKKWCVVGWCPLEKKPDKPECSKWQFWC